MKKIDIALLIVMLLVTHSCKKHVVIIGLDQPIHHDDFDYSVTSFEKRKEIHSGSDNTRANGTYLIVTFKVSNHALRVSHKWDNTIAYVVSDDGRKFENSINAQCVLNRAEPFGWQENYNTPHGEVQTTKLVFDIPGDLTHACVMVRGETLMGDMFNRNQFRRTKIKLF